MKKLRIALVIVALATFGLIAQGQGQGQNQDPWAASNFNNFRLRAVGPALMSGRVNVVAVHPDDKQTWYIGVASGGVWKTTNSGTTFTPVPMDSLPVADDGTFRAGELPPTLAGSITLRVVDTDRSPGAQALDQLRIGLLAQHDRGTLTAADLGRAQRQRHHVERQPERFDVLTAFRERLDRPFGSHLRRGQPAADVIHAEARERPEDWVRIAVLGAGLHAGPGRGRRTRRSCGDLGRNRGLRERSRGQS